MSLLFKNYKSGYKIVSLALDNVARAKLEHEELPFVFTDNERSEIILCPEETILSSDTDDLNKIQTYNNYDVFEIWRNGAFIRKYDDSSDDNYFFITGKCNSNCVMCPSPEYSRKASNTIDLTYLLKLAKHIPSDVRHMTITGGEPFLIGEEIFVFFQYLKEKFEETEFLILTNGRVFAIQKYLHRFCETVPNYSILAIPIHGSSAYVHDSITRSKGSFVQTKIGLKRLLKKGFPIEIRVVVSKMNIYDLCNIAKLIIDEFKDIEYVSVIAMEMTGNARTNKERVWISYKKSFQYIADAVRILIENGVDTRLYNFPLCTVDKPFWALCKKSISNDKVRFAKNCDHCRYKSACGGVFAGTLQLEENEMRPII